MNACKKYFLILPLAIGIINVGIIPAGANSRAYSFNCTSNMATKIFDIQINKGDLIGINTSQCLQYQQFGDIGIDPLHPVRDTSCVTSWCTTGGTTLTTAFGTAVVQLKASSDDASPGWIIRVYYYGSTPPPIPQLTPSPTRQPSPKATPSVSADSIQKSLSTQEQVVGINQTAYTFCGNGKTNSGANSNGFTGQSKITIKRGETGQISISIIGTPRRVIWRFTPETQIGFNSGAGDFGTLIVSDCSATYRAPSLSSNPTVSLLVDVRAGVTTPSLAPTPSPSPKCTKCPVIGAPVPAPKSTSITPNQNANGEQGPSAVGWLTNTQIYVPSIAQVAQSQTPTTKTCTPTFSIYISSSTYGTAEIWIDGKFIADNQIFSHWGVGSHHVYITDGYGRILVDRIYNSTCALTQIKFN